MWLADIPWARRTWALTVLTALAPSERYHRKTGRTHKKITDWARQMILQLRRWLPNRAIVVVADSAYAALDPLRFCQSMSQPVIFITRLRLDAALYEPAPRRLPGQKGRPRVKGRRLPTLKELLSHPDTCWSRESVAWYGGAVRTVELSSGSALWYHAGKPPAPLRWVLIRDPLRQFHSQALLCTDLSVSPARIVEWFTLRWQVEVTFQEARAHLGVGTQRQWSDLAIARATPALLGLFSWITLSAELLREGGSVPTRKSAWYVKSEPTFSDAIALARYHMWNASEAFCVSGRKPDVVKVPATLFSRLVESLAYAA